MEQKLVKNILENAAYFKGGCNFNSNRKWIMALSTFNKSKQVHALFFFFYIFRHLIGAFVQLIPPSSQIDQWFDFSSRLYSNGTQMYLIMHLQSWQETSMHDKQVFVLIYS